MTISSVGSATIVNFLQSNYNVKKTAAPAEDKAPEISAPVPANNINLKNISPREYDELRKSLGLEFNGHPVVWVGKLGGSPEQAQDTKVDYLGQIEASVAFHKSRGEPNQFLEDHLAHLKALHGLPYPGSTDFSV